MIRQLDRLPVVLFSTAEPVTREILGNIPAWLIITFYLLVMVACGIACAGFLYRLFSVHLKGVSEQTDDSVSSWRTRLASVVSYAALHRQLLRDRYAGIAHLLTFYGFVILFIGTVLVFLEHQTPLHFFYGRFYLVSSLIIDLGGVAFLVGLGMFLWRRMVTGNDRILREWWVTTLVVLLLGIGVSGFAVEATRIAQDFPEFEIWSITGYSLAKAFAAVGIRGETATAWHRFSWSLHALLCIAFFALLPWRFFSHMVYSLVSWMLRSTAPKSQLTAISLQHGRDRKPPGVTRWNEFSIRDLLQIDACTTCGRCNDVCPAHAAGKPLTPREIVLGVRSAVNARHTNGNSLSPLIAEDALWSCTTCAACNEACPVGIDVYGKIIDLRRGRVEGGCVPDSAEKVFESSAVDENPFHKLNDDRMNWGQGLTIPVAAENEQIELLYWIGCSGCFDPEGQSVSRAMIKILNHLGVRYRVLGKNERCTGDPARRMGEEGLFQQMARRNLEQFHKHEVKTILVHCPHCFNTFRNEYPALDRALNQSSAEIDVEHHSQFLARMIAEKKLSLPRETSETLTFHDPCYLGRGNNDVESPREVLYALGGTTFVEMERNRRNSACCGAGGGSLWLDVRGDDRSENIRIREAEKSGACTLVTACPFCKTMLEAGRTQTGGESDSRTLKRVKDLAELIVEAEGL